MVNAFAMRRAIGLLERNTTPLEILARWTIFEQRFPALADLLIDHPEWTGVLAKGLDGKTLDKYPAPLQPFIESEIVRSLIGNDEHALTTEHVRTITKGSAS